MGTEKEKNKKINRKFDEDESPDSVALLVKFVGKEDIGLFFFLQHPGTTSILLH
jgi:hypothetical protein